ncbi:FmdB family transcriptional regulator [Streptomonospora sp. S1-112]|uniref:FmdB family transcriptional regulator n=1 Tax=Streptomonospora mangrovi TaxID=2883123 RepID=A0A9X3SF31_9ACTN|nr:FmdB family zinc ribbon protein [Streptomonospora mangrovi]MDA0564390.1 FmdB family transcriptional regulator [Streptomonospora mangrovi]
MPTYQYACTECGSQLEAVQSFSDDALTVCPECQGRLRKVYSAVGIVFKGSGFYRTDSNSSSNRSVMAGASKNGGKDDSSGGAKSESTGSDSGSASSGSDSSSTAKADSSSAAATAAK